MFPNSELNMSNICSALSIYNVSTTIKYLGIPLSFFRHKNLDFLPLIESIIRKLSGWKANLLSFAGHLHFLKFSILNSVAYWIRSSIIPKMVTKFIRRLSSKFLFFGDVDATRKLHLVPWDKVCKPKLLGGFGLHSLQALQFGFNYVVICRMYNCNSPLSLWLISQYTSPW